MIITAKCNIVMDSLCHLHCNFYSLTLHCVCFASPSLSISKDGACKRGFGGGRQPNVHYVRRRERIIQCALTIVAFQHSIHYGSESLIIKVHLL